MKIIWFILLINMSLFAGNFTEKDITKWFNKEYPTYIKVIKEVKYIDSFGKTYAKIKMVNKKNIVLFIEVLVANGEKERRAFKKCLPIMEKKSDYLKISYNKKYCESRFLAIEYAEFIIDMMRKVAPEVSNAYNETYNEIILGEFRVN